MTDTSWYGRAGARVRAARQRMAYAAWRRAEASPAVYLACCVVLALLGYAYLASFPLLAALMLIGLPEAIGTATALSDGLMVGVRVAVAAFGLAVTAYVLRLHFPVPGGLRITAAQAPHLFQEIHQTAEHLGTRLPDRVQVTGGSRIEWVRTPKMGFPFLFSHTLLVGLAGLQTLSAVQARGALAAQLGQAGLRRAPLLAWVCYLRPVWTQFPGARAAPGHWLFIPWCVGGFFRVYAPLYAYCTRLAARLHQHETDRYALEVINDEDLMQLLVATTLAERFLTRHFWPKIRSLVGRADGPPVRPHASMASSYRRGLDRATAERWLREALDLDPAPDAAAASLSRRLEAIGHDAARVLLAPEKSAAESLLGPLLPALQQALDRPWEQARVRALKGRARANAAAGAARTPAATS